MRGTLFYLSIFFAALFTLNCGGSDSAGGDGGGDGGDSDASWTLVFDEEGNQADLPSIEGTSLQGSKWGTNYQLTGTASNSQLVTYFDVGDELEEKEYSPSFFKVSWTELDYICVLASGLTVTVTRVDPFKGSFSGPVNCYPEEDVNDNFEIEVSGVLNN